MGEWKQPKASNDIRSKMSNSAAGGKTGSESRKPRGPFKTLLRARRVRDNEELSAEDAASTLFRFFRSKHVADLKLVAKLALILLVIHIVLVVIYALAAADVHYVVAESAARKAVESAAHKGVDPAAYTHHAGLIILTDVFESVVTYIGPAITICGAIVAWSYLSASKRLGIVDLFACEIKTLCRVGTIFDVGKRYVAMYQSKLEIAENHAATEGIPAAPSVAEPMTDELLSRSSVSEEHYFPIFENNSSDLESLEALVVGNITEYYTYMKSARDLQRILASINASQAAKSSAGAPHDAAKDAAGRETVADIIYVVFLGYESARKAIADLIEFQPTRDENIIVILMTELVCFSFLCEHLKQDSLRFPRLQLRELGYEKAYRELIESVNAPHNNEENVEYWHPAQRMIPELQDRYKAAMKTLQRCKQ
jgi:hypothetical protein